MCSAKASAVCNTVPRLDTSLPLNPLKKCSNPGVQSFCPISCLLSKLLHSPVQSSTVLYYENCTLQYCTVLYCGNCTVHYSTVLYCENRTVQYSTVLYCGNCTGQYITVLYSENCTVQHCTAQLSSRSLTNNADLFDNHYSRP